MTISDHDRKILWGRSGSRCALCRTPLVAAKTTTDPEAIVGDKCHIVARARGGPRAGDLPDGQNDAYDNLILLCKVHHKAVDGQPIEYPIDRLRRMKEEHEAWVADTLSSSGQPSRIEVVDDPSAPPAHLTLLSTGAEVWEIVRSPHASRFHGLEDDDADQEAVEVSDQFLQDAHDWGLIGDDLEGEGPAALRRAKRALEERVKELRARNLVVFGSRHARIVRGGVGPPARWYEVTLEVVRSDDPRLTTEPPAPDPQ